MRPRKATGGGALGQPFDDDVDGSEGDEGRSKVRFAADNASGASGGGRVQRRATGVPSALAAQAASVQRTIIVSDIVMAAADPLSSQAERVVLSAAYGAEEKEVSVLNCEAQGEFEFIEADIPGLPIEFAAGRATGSWAVGEYGMHTVQMTDASTISFYIAFV